MLNFPVPYPDELIYSLVARAGIHLGLTSPKQLLDEVFANRHVIATVDLPNHLAALIQLLPQSTYDVVQLAYSHTLFPIYAPFNSEEKRQICLKQMAGSSQGALHSRLGMAASRVKQLHRLRYCPQCLQEQLHQVGEYYWQRSWQVIGADCCLLHGSLATATIERHSSHRHEFFAAAPLSCPILPQLAADELAIRITCQVHELLQQNPDISPTFSQWSLFYHQLATSVGCAKAKQIQHAAVHELVSSHWSYKWLKQHGLTIDCEMSNWLQAIFRKHRKSFSYLEHIVVLDSLLPESWSITAVLDEVRNIKTGVSLIKTNHLDEEKVGQSKNYRERWQHLLASYSIKQARISHPALYAWLYRNDRLWLMKINRAYHQTHVRENRRVDWASRDRTVCRQLLHILNQSELDLGSPRLSRNWFLSKIPFNAMVEKNIYRMPLTCMFFKRYCESVAEYQIRRLASAWIVLTKNGNDIRRWQLLRESGLSEERLRPMTNYLLHCLLEL